MSNKYVGNLSFLSNSFPASVFINGVKYPTVAHAYNALKTDDASVREQICLLPTAREAYVAGRNVPLRPDWNRVNRDIMLDLLRKKFENPFFAHSLANVSDDELGNDWLAQLLKMVRDELKCRKVANEV